jgi:hypothetical protein
MQLEGGSRRSPASGQPGGRSAYRVDSQSIGGLGFPALMTGTFGRYDPDALTSER